MLVNYCFETKLYRFGGVFLDFFEIFEKSFDDWLRPYLTDSVLLI